MIPRIDNHDRLAAARMLMQFRDAPTHEGVVGALARQVQEVEDALYAVQFVRDVAGASGAQLDEIGAVVGQPREGRDDATYRRWIHARMLINRGAGEIETLIQVMRLTLDAENPRAVESYPARVHLHTDGLSITDAEAADVLRMLRGARAAGVRLVLYYEPHPLPETFTFNGTEEQGFGDSADPTAGGALSAAIQ